MRLGAAAWGLSSRCSAGHRGRAEPGACAHHARSTQLEWTIAPNAPAAASPDVRRLDFSRGGLGASSYSVAVDEADRRVDDNLLALFDPTGYFHLRA